MDETTPQSPPLTRADLIWYGERIRDLQKKIRLLTRILVDKKIIGEEMAKTFEETTLIDKKELLEWYNERRKRK